MVKIVRVWRIVVIPFQIGENSCKSVASLKLVLLRTTQIIWYRQVIIWCTSPDTTGIFLDHKSDICTYIGLVAL